MAEDGTNTAYYELEKLVVQFIRTEPEADLRVKLATFIERRMGVDEVTDLAAFLGVKR